MSRSSKRIVCRVRVDDTAKVVEFTWSEGSASFKPYALYGEQVDDFRANVQSAATRCSHWCAITNDVSRIATFPSTSACHELAECGHNLYNQMFDRAARDGEHVEKISTWLPRHHRDRPGRQPGDRLRRPALVRPLEPRLRRAARRGSVSRRRRPAAFAPFWGMRYNICGGQPVDPLRRMPLPTKPHVLIVLDPVVLDGLGTYADKDGLTQRDRLEQFLSSQGLAPVTSSAALAKALKQDRPHVIYWLGHADPDALHLGPERIDQTALRNVLRNMKRIPGQTGGLVFLNACRTAESGDLGSFLKTFHNAEFSGLIGTEEQTLDSFANPFGLGVLERFFTPGTSIGGMLRDLRQSHGPLGLLYGAYCPPDLHVRAEDEPGARGQVGQIEELTGAGGQMLGASRTDVVEAETASRDQPSTRSPIPAAGRLRSRAPRLCSTAATTTSPDSP